MSSTHSPILPAGPIRDIGKKIPGAFHSARQAHMPLKELIIRYQQLPITAREFRNGALFSWPKKQHLRPASILNAYV